jgi:hypothetical protein
VGSDRSDDHPEPSVVPDLSVVEGANVDVRDEGGEYRTGLMIIRAWVEEGSRKPLRAQVRLTGDVSTGFERTVNLTDIQAVCAEVEAWLRDVLATTEPD